MSAIDCLGNTDSSGMPGWSDGLQVGVGVLSRALTIKSRSTYPPVKRWRMRGDTTPRPRVRLPELEPLRKRNNAKD